MPTATVMTMASTLGRDRRSSVERMGPFCKRSSGEEGGLMRALKQEAAQQGQHLGDSVAIAVAHAAVSSRHVAAQSRHCALHRLRLGCGRLPAARAESANGWLAQARGAPRCSRLHGLPQMRAQMSVWGDCYGESGRGAGLTRQALVREIVRLLSATSSHLAEIPIADIQPSNTQFEIWHVQSVTGSNAKNKCL